MLINKKACIVMFFVLLGSFVGCSQPIGGGYVHPNFSTEYTIDEHVQRIKDRTEGIFQDEIQSGAIVDYSVEIVYAFYDEDPEYFLVEIEYANEWDGVYHTNYPRYDDDTPMDVEYTTRYKHLIGFIENDTYKTGLHGYFGKDKAAFKDGKSCYDLLGYAGNKKYYGASMFAVESNGGIVRIYSSISQGPVGLLWNEESFEKKTVSKDKQKQYMTDNWKKHEFIYGGYSYEK